MGENVNIDFDKENLTKNKDHKSPQPRRIIDAPRSNMNVSSAYPQSNQIRNQPPQSANISPPTILSFPNPTSKIDSKENKTPNFEQNQFHSNGPSDIFSITPSDLPISNFKNYSRKDKTVIPDQIPRVLNPSYQFNPCNQSYCTANYFRKNIVNFENVEKRRLFFYKNIYLVTQDYQICETHQINNSSLIYIKTSPEITILPSHFLME
jgi:hypothetical protein